MLLHSGSDSRNGCRNDKPTAEKLEREFEKKQNPVAYFVFFQICQKSEGGWVESRPPQARLMI
jgi:hypothetical protein